MQTSLPGKQADKKNREKSEKSFFKKVLEVLKYQVASQTNIFIIGGPGKTKNYFYDYLKENWDLKDKKIHLEDASSGSIVGIKEILKRDIMNQIAIDYQFVRIEKIIDQFLLRLSTDSNKVGYGVDNIISCLEMGAAETVLMSDRFFRSSDESNREKINKILNLTEETRSGFMLVDYKTSTGKTVEQFGNVIAILRFDVFSEV